MNDPVKSISTIRNFMGNAGRNTCNDYLYKALQDAVEALELQIPKKVVNRRELKDFHKKTYCIEGDYPECGHEGLKSSETNVCYECGQVVDYF